MANPRLLISRTDYNHGLIELSTDIRGSSTRDIFKPQAVQANNKTYFTWVDNGGAIQIVTFDHISKTTSAIVQVAPFSDYSADTDLEHSTPSICIDNSGYIYIFYGCHNTQMKFRKSLNPYDITLWGKMQTPSPATLATYAMPIVMANGDIVVFYRQQGASTWGTNMMKSSDGGATWSNTAVILPSTAGMLSYHMGAVKGSDESLHLFVNFRPNSDNPSDPFGTSYYLKSADEGVTWKKVDGTSLTLPANESNLGSVEATGSYPGDIKLNSTNSPYVCYTLNSSSSVVFASWNGSSWAKNTVCSVATYQFETCEMDIISDSTIDIYTVAGTVTNLQGGNIQRYRSTNSGSTWSLAETITSNGDTFRRHFFPKIVKSYNSELKLIWIYGAAIAYNASTYPPGFLFESYPKNAMRISTASGNSRRTATRTPSRISRSAAVRATLS